MKINWDLKLNEEEISSELESFFKRGFHWRNGTNYCQIWAPKFFIEGAETIIDYFENIKPEFGNKDQIEMLEVARLMITLENAKQYNRYDLWDSDYFLQK